MIQAPKTIKPADVYARPVFHVRMAACWRGRRSKPFAESKPARNGRIKGDPFDRLEIVFIIYSVPIHLFQAWNDCYSRQIHLMDIPETR